MAIREPMAVASNPSALAPDELETYHRDGLVQPRFRFDSDTRAALRALAENTLAESKEKRPESIVCPHLEGWSPISRSLVRSWLHLAGNPALVDRVVDCLGPNVILWGSQFFCKPAQTGMEVPWHQDGEYWPIRPLSTCTVWLAVDDSTPENGCLRYIPGSHLERRIYPHLTDPRSDLVLNQVTDPAYFDKATARDDALPAGAFSLHHVHLIHGSQPNRSGQRRAALVLRYMAAESLYNRSLKLDGGTSHYQTRFSERPLYLMRGQAGANITLIEKHARYR